VTGTEVDVAETYLTQAEELSRGDSDTDTDLRTRIQRLRADVQYWRARRKVEAASAQLREAVTRFREARDGLPRHNSDADAWAEFVESLTRELGLGPAESRWRLRLPPAAPAASGRPARSPPPDAGVPGTPDAEPGMALPPTRDAAPTEPEPGAIPESPPPPKVPEGGTLS
jgi:hypothetical protein